MEFCSFDYITEIKSRLAARGQARGNPFCAYTHVYGCAQNTADMENIRGMLEKMGYSFTDAPENADIIVINTCAVRDGAEAKIYGNLGQFKALKEKNTDLTVCVCGCMMQEPQIVEKIKKSYPFVDVIFGTHNISNFPALFLNRLKTGRRTVEILEKGEIAEGMPALRENAYSCNVSIMYGCDNFCSYCIVPYTRGREHSRRSEDILAEIKTLVQNGCTEINLLGQNVNSYGKGLDEKITFAELLRKINDVSGVRRIRFLTSHPKDLSDELILAMAQCKKVCKSLHLPFQAGSDRVLRAMNRHYTSAGYLELISKLREKMPDIALTTDVIVGFPGETQEDFLRTLEILKKVRFDGVYSFIYSPREGTVAAKMPDPMPPEQKHKNLELLLETQRDINYAINKSYIGKTCEVLVCGNSKNDTSLLTGHTDTNKIVHFSGTNELIGQYVQVKITNARSFYLTGEMI